MSKSIDMVHVCTATTAVLKGALNQLVLNSKFVNLDVA